MMFFEIQAVRVTPEPTGFLLLEGGGNVLLEGGGDVILEPP